MKPSTLVRLAVSGTRTDAVRMIVTVIAAGFEDSLALKSDGTVYAWGDNNFGETNVPSGLNNVIVGTSAAVVGPRSFWNTTSS